MARQIKQCKLCLHTKPLCDSHVYPASFFGEGNRLVEENNPYPKRKPTGPYDNAILCEFCEDYLNTEFDDFAKKTLLDKAGVIREVVAAPNNKENITLYRLENRENYDKISRFFVSVLWRASVASHSDFEYISLGPYEEKARQTVLNKKYDFSDYFSVALFCFPNINGKINMISRRTHIEGVNFYVIMIGTIKAYIKCDKQKFPSWGLPLVLSSHNNILMVEDVLQTHPEYQIIKKSAQKLANYRKVKRSPRK